MIIYLFKNKKNDRLINKRIKPNIGNNNNKIL